MTAIRPNSPLGYTLVALSTLTALSAVAMIALNIRDAVVNNSAPAPFFLAFEGLTLFAAIFGVLLGRGRFDSGPSLGLLCVAGAVALAAILGFESAGRQIAGRSLLPYLGARGLLAGAFAAAAAYLVLRRRPRASLASLGKGIVAGVLCIAGVLAFKALIPVLSSVHPIAIVFIILFAGVFVLAALAAAVHFTIRAFELGQVGGHAVPADTGAGGPSA